MKAFLILGLALLLATAVWLMGKYGATPADVFAERLYQRGLLTAPGRDELRRRIRHNQLKFERTDPFEHSSQEYVGASRAAILNFCAEAFQLELGYRLPGPETDDLSFSIFIAGQALDSLSQNSSLRVQQERFQKELKRFGGDTAALKQWLDKQLPARLKIEAAIPAEDSLPQGGWTIYPPLGSPSGAKGLPHWIGEGHSVMGKTRTRTARDLFAVGLLDKDAYEELRQTIISDHVMEGQVCQLAANLMQQRETWAQDYAQQQRWLRQLTQTNLLTSSQRQRITQETRPYKLKSLFDVVGYCQQGQIINLRRLSQQPQVLYPALFRQVQKLLPNFQYTDLQVTVGLEDEGLDLLAENVTLSFRADGRRYENTFLQDYRRKDGTDPNPNEWAGVGEDFHKSINQWLADQHSPLRLYQAWTSDAQSVHGTEHLGLLFMTQAQRKLWGADYSFSIFSRESYDQHFASAAIEQLVADYQRLGLFSHLSAAAIAKGRNDALAGAKSSYAEVLMSFPQVIYAFDWESANPPYPYADLTRKLAAISRGGFAPTQVIDGFGTDYPRTATVPFSFRLSQRLYRTSLKVQSDWLAAESIELMRQALREQHASGQFYDCLDGEGYIFLTLQQHKVLSQRQPELFKTAVDTTAGSPAF